MPYFRKLRGVFTSRVPVSMFTGPVRGSRENKSVGLAGRRWLGAIPTQVDGWPCLSQTLRVWIIAWPAFTSFNLKLTAMPL